MERPSGDVSDVAPDVIYVASADDDADDFVDDGEDGGSIYEDDVDGSEASWETLSGDEGGGGGGAAAEGQLLPGWLPDLALMEVIRFAGGSGLFHLTAVSPHLGVRCLEVGSLRERLREICAPALESMRRLLVDRLCEIVIVFPLIAQSVEAATTLCLQ